MTDLDTMTLPAAAMANMLGLTPRRLQQLVGDGHVPASDRGQYAVTVTAQAYFRFLQGDARRTTRSAANSRVSDLRAEEIEARNDRRAAAMLKEARQEALDMVDLFGGALKADIYGIPARVTKDLQLRRRIEAEIDGAFAAVAHRIATGIEADDAKERRR